MSIALSSTDLVAELFDKQKEALARFFEKTDTAALSRAVDLLMGCEGMLIFTGVGKSGVIGKKIASTMTSTGTRSLYLSPTNALHGDIGIVNPKDVFVILSKSGESEELMNLIPFLRNRGVKTIALVCNGSSRLARAVDFPVVLPDEEELCPFGLAPTTSATMQLIIGDLFCVSLMQLKQFSLEEYANSHPAGRIGKRTAVKVEDLMLSGKDLPICRPEELLLDILVELSEKRCGAILVVDPESRLLGIFTDGDLRRALQDRGGGALHLPVRELMTRSPRCIGPRELAWSAMQLMEEDQNRPVTVLPVVENGIAAGLIKMHDMIQAGL